MIPHPILTIQFKRFKDNGTKINSSVDFKAKLDIKIDYKWSSYNDTSLINTGYAYTGKTRTIEK